VRVPTQTKARDPRDGALRSRIQHVICISTTGKWRSTNVSVNIKPLEDRIVVRPLDAE